MTAYPAPADRRHGAIVLVHGAWVGEWCWEPLLPLLESSGRRVVPVSLTGHGQRAAESGPHITLDHHVADVVATLETLDLSDVTMVGHSYGGRVITKAWPMIGERVERMVYLDAHAPFPSAAPPSRVGGSGAGTSVGGSAPSDEMIPFSGYEPDPVEFGGAESVDWFMQRVVDHSPATLLADFMVELPTELAKTYVFASGDPNSRFAGYAAAADFADDWEYEELESSHWIMICHPEGVTEIILR